MNRRLACVDIPNPALQFLLNDVPEWKASPVVLLDRDEANGRIIDMNPAAADLGIGRGMLYGPCLGIHRNLKGGVIDPKTRETRLEKVHSTLKDFSPFVEQSWFHEGTFWLDATGLAHLFSSVKTWLFEIRAAVNELQLECSLSAGYGRFSTYAAARLKPMGAVNIFTDAEAESAWLQDVPVNILVLNDDIRKLFRRLKLLTVGNVLEIPSRDISNRLSRDAAVLVDFIKTERLIPLQYTPEEEPFEWTVFPEEPLVLLADLIEQGSRLVDLCVGISVNKGFPVKSVEFRLTGSDTANYLEIKPVQPTRDRELLHRLLASRLEHARIESPVGEIWCRGIFAAAVEKQQNLFEEDHQRCSLGAEKVLAAIQSERGADSIQYAQLKDDPHPARQFELCPWKGFSSRKASLSHSSTPNPHLIRRIRFSPCDTRTEPSPDARFSYSGGWWNKPYHHEMGYSFHRGRTEWVQGRVSGDRVEQWDLIGWVD